MAKKNRRRMKKKEALAYLEEFLNKYSQDERILRMKDSPHHPNISAYTHTFRVVRKCVGIVKFFHMKVEWDNLLLGALLHDFYLYDFHEHSSFKNCFLHPKMAMKNAKELFDANDHVIKIIKTHMFPLPIWKIPTSREAWVVSLADKLVSIKEAFTRK